jgi:hypothetical protein
LDSLFGEKVIIYDSSFELNELTTKQVSTGNQFLTGGMVCTAGRVKVPFGKASSEKKRQQGETETKERKRTTGKKRKKKKE